MSLVAAVVQYPLPCAECKSYTSRPAAVIRDERKITCRVCGSVTHLSDQQLESLERTLEHMNVCGLRKDALEDTCKEAEEAVAD